MVAKARSAQCVKINARFDTEIGRHEHMVEPPGLAARGVGDIHGAVSVGFPVRMPEPVIIVILE